MSVHRDATTGRIAALRVLANLESVVGVLYIAVLMARLVGLYSARETVEPSA